jgi:DNA repair protein RecO (recombination protein O)
MSAETSFPAFVLHQRPWHENSVLLDVFSREHGRIHVVAKGVKGKRRSSWSAHLQLFVPLILHCKKKGEWWPLIDAESAGPSFALRDEAHLCGLYCNELLMRLLQLHDTHAEVFQHYLSCLSSLSIDADHATTLRQFEWQLITSLGYGLDLRADQAGDGIELTHFYRFYDQGLWPIKQATDVDFSGRDILLMADGLWSEAPQSSKRLLRLMLQPHLGAEELKTREMWRQFESLKKLAEE